MCQSMIQESITFILPKLWKSVAFIIFYSLYYDLINSHAHYKSAQNKLMHQLGANIS